MARVTRRAVATPADIKFIEPQYRRLTSPIRSLVDSKKSVLFWSITLFFTVRVFFMDGGYFDLQEKKAVIEKRQHELQVLEQDNRDLRQEIIQVRKSRKFQKRLAREHLGVIAKDEFLILFASDLGSKSK